MSDESEKENHWQELASEIGAQPAADAQTDSEQIGQPSVEHSPDEVESVKPATPLPEAAPADWGSLASTLGAAQPRPTETPSNEVSTSEQPTDAPSLEDLLASEPAESSKAEPPASEWNQQPPETPPLETQEEAVAEDLAEATFGDSPAETVEPRPRRVPRGRPSDDGSEARPENFAASMDNIETAVEFAPDVNGPDEPADDAGDADDADERAEDAGDDVSAGATTVVEADDAPKRRRRRRRGRRGASNRRGEQTENSTAEDEASLSDEAAGADEAAGDSQRSDQEDSSDDDQSSPTDRRTGHRNIPTWQEAIGLVITANMESRQKSPKGAGGSGRGGRGRGRGRGGRGRSGGGRKSDNRK